MGWGLVAPALIWTGAFFVLPFAAMLALSFAHMEGREVVPGFDPGNYIRIFTDWTMLKALINSLEITVVVTVASDALSEATETAVLLLSGLAASSPFGAGAVGVREERYALGGERDGQRRVLPRALQQGSSARDDARHAALCRCRSRLHSRRQVRQARDRGRRTTRSRRGRRGPRRRARPRRADAAKRHRGAR